MIEKMLLTPYFLDEEVALGDLAEVGWWVNQADLPQSDQQARMLAMYKPLADQVVLTVKEGGRPVSVAGDCCTTLAVMAGLQRADLAPTLIWLDAHGDFNTWDTTPSGFLGGMPLAWLTGRGEEKISAGLSLTSTPDADIFLTDARDLDPGELTLVRGSAVNHLPDVAMLLEFDLPDKPIYVHFDVDILNTQVVPAVSYPAVGGPDEAQLAKVFDYLAWTGKIAAVSVSAWNPAMEGADQSRDVVLRLLTRLLN